MHSELEAEEGAEGCEDKLREGRGKARNEGNKVRDEVLDDRKDTVHELGEDNAVCMQEKSG